MTSDPESCYPKIMKHYCEVDGCDRPPMNLGKTGLCARHYKRKQRGVPEWDNLVPERCVDCKAPINTRPKTTGGRISTRCTDCQREHKKTLRAMREASHDATQAA